MKQTPIKHSSKKNGYLSDDDNIRYKLNKDYFNNVPKIPGKPILKDTKKLEKIKNSDNDVRYMFPVVTLKTKPIEQKSKAKQKIKVNFWSNKQNARLSKTGKKESSSRRHTISTTSEETISRPKSSAVKVRKRVSFLPSPLFTENHVPMVTVPDDLTINLNEEEAFDLREDLNSAFVNSIAESHQSSSKRKSRSSTTQTSPKGTKRKHEGNENELEFFSKYVVQKLRRMETNQRIYSENLINTVLMLGQLGELHGKSKISDA